MKACQQPPRVRQVKIKLTSNLTVCVCVQRVTKYQKYGIKRDRYFVNEVEIQLRDKASTKIVTVTYPMQRSYLAL